MTTLWRDFRYAARLLSKDWRYSATVIFTLTLCIAANSAIFAIVYSVLLRPLRVPESEQLLLLSNQYPRAGVGESRNSAAGDYYDRQKGITALSQQAMFKNTSHVMQIDNVATTVDGMAVTPTLFPTLQVNATVGRTFTTAEGEPGNERKVILSYALWQKLYAGSSGVIGKDLRLSDRPYQIAGVMPKDFQFYDPDVRYWVPLAFTPEQREQHHNNNWIHIGRLKAGASIAQVQEQVNAINTANLERFPMFREAVVNAGFHTRVERLQDLLVKGVRETLYLLWAGALFVLLIGAVNIANLSLARMSHRRKEIGTRIALGAGQWQIARQLLVENILVASLGGLAGLGLAWSAIRALAALGFDRFPRASEVEIDLPVALYSMGIAMCIGLLIGLIPAAGVFRASLAAVLHESSRGGSKGRRSRLVRQSLVVAQIAVAFVLLAGSGLLLASFRNLMDADPGFRTDGILTISTSAIQASRQGPAALRSLMQRSLDAIRQIPGVHHAGVTDSIPLGGNHSDSVTLAEGYIMQPGESVIAPTLITVTPGYMEAMGIRLVRGRYLNDGDRDKMLPAIVVDETVARKFWANTDPIGRRMYMPQSADLKPVPDQRWLTVVGVVRPVRQDNLEQLGSKAGTIYFAYDQQPRASITFAIHAPVASEPVVRAARAALAAADPTLALFDIRSMNERVRLSLASRRTALSLAVAFGALALLLSAVGIFGVLSYLLSQRRREIGIRLAVGSTPSGIFQLFLREGAALTGTGLLLGLAGAASMQRAIASQVYDVQPFDPIVLGSVVALLGAVAIVACLGPARRATEVDPVTVLNED